jgi:hypothetical protein
VADGGRPWWGASAWRRDRGMGQRRGRGKGVVGVNEGEREWAPVEAK